MSDLTALATIKNNILAQLQDISANPKPNYSIDGQQVSWQSHFDSLMNALERINAQINAAEPYEIVSRGTS
jgi:ACT domain-containing protein